MIANWPSWRTCGQARRGYSALTSTRAHEHLPCKLPVAKDSPEGREAGLRLDSIVDCQTLATVPREEIVRRLGRFPSETMRRVDQALQDALGLREGPMTTATGQPR